MQILAISTRQAKPSFRHRVERMTPYFADRGHQVDVAFVPKRWWERARLFQRCRHYDAVFIQKRLFSRLELALIRRAAKRLVYDVDDAVMYDAQGNRNARRRRRFNAITEAADLVICGNRYLGVQASFRARRVEIVPTCIDTERFHPRRQPPVDGITRIGWTGSRSTIRYLNSLLEVLSEFDGRAQLEIISDSKEGLNWERLGRLPYRFVPWSPDVEVDVAAGFDIGLMPLPDNRWTRGKCGFKALQYMALGRVAVASPVGVNSDIISDGENGFLCHSAEHWRDVLKSLVDASDDRIKIGRAARKQVEERFSADVHGPRLVRLVEQLRQHRRAG